MIFRSLTLVAGLSGAAVLSQYPEFSQQYLQRLAGAVDALQQEVAVFDAAAQQAGLTRDQALAEYTGTVFLEQRGADAAALIQRSERLASDLDALRSTGPIGRLVHAPRLSDPEIWTAAMGDFRPAVPLTLEGAVCALLGFVLGGGLVRGALNLVQLLGRRRKALAS